jgi:hypothetical protein
MRLSRPIYESLPVLYALAGAGLLGVSYHLHSGSVSVLLMIVGVLCLIGGAAIWLRRRDFRAADAQYGLNAHDASADDDTGSNH